MKKYFIVSSVFVIAISFFLTGCSDNKELMVHCAAGMKKPVCKIAEEFQKETGIKVVLNYDGSNRLYGALTVTRQGDIYIAGDTDYIEKAVQAGMADKASEFCIFTPVIITGKGNPEKIMSLEDFLRPGLNIGFGNPEGAAVGRNMLEMPGYQRLNQEGLKKNIKTLSPTVNELALFVEMGSLDASVVWDSVALLFADSIEIIEILEEDNHSVSTGLCTLSFAQNKKEAEKFFEYATGEKGRKILLDSGFTVPELITED